MFLFSTKSYYALKALMEMCRLSGGGNLVSLAEISARQNIPLKYLEQIMLNLKRAGFVESQRGVAGGFRLRRSAEEISVGQVVRALENYEEGREMNAEGPSIDDQVLSAIIEQAREAAVRVLDRETLHTLLQKAEERQRSNEAINYFI
ncbi:MAG: Rrf2 family transcriptional regulator [candidate division KSB1 bacterium]|nr:Rrf2 family transcriptional regulator [candidate division KSB1 bacterium]MDZ7346230.1 Rrf2 family transcriptional regulator [candidate division KSB1 bacterium]